MTDLISQMRSYLIAKAESNPNYHFNEATTFKNYVSCVNQMLKHLGYKLEKGENKEYNYPQFDYILEHLEPLLNAIQSGNINNKTITEYSKRNYLTTLINLIKSQSNPEYNDILKLVQDAFKSNATTIDKDLNTHEFSERQSKNIATLEEIDTALGAWKKALPKKIDSRENYIRHAIWTAFNLQRHIPIRSDLIKAKLLTTTQSKKMGDLPKDFNYIIINKTGKPTGTLYLNNTKTSNTFTNTTVPIPENVVKTLRSLLPHLEKYSVDNRMLINNYGEAISSNSYTNYIRDATAKYLNGRTISTNLLRVIYDSTLYNLDKETEEKKQKTADIQQHSKETQYKHYVKFMPKQPTPE